MAGSLVCVPGPTHLLSALPPNQTIWPPAMPLTFPQSPFMVVPPGRGTPLIPSSTGSLQVEEVSRRWPMSPWSPKTGFGPAGGTLQSSLDWEVCIWKTLSSAESKSQGYRLELNTWIPHQMCQHGAVELQVANLEVWILGIFLPCLWGGAFWNGLMGHMVHGRSAGWGVRQPVGGVPPFKSHSKSSCILVVNS